MTLQVLGAQASVTGTITVPASTTLSGEITVMTTAASADYVALVTLSLVATGGTYGASGGFALPGPGGGVAAVGNFTPVSGGGVAVGAYVGNSYPAFGATSTVKVGPSTAVKIPYCFVAGSSAASLTYMVNAHVAYVKNP